MKLLLDTNVLIWVFEDSRRLKPTVRAAVQDRDNDVLVSTVSLWEVLVKQRVGKLHLDWRKLRGAIGEAGFRRIGMEMEHLEVLDVLPRHHGDPFDHMLIAQAIAENATLVTADRYCQMYPVGLMQA